MPYFKMESEIYKTRSGYDTYSPKQTIMLRKRNKTKKLNHSEVCNRVTRLQTATLRRSIQYSLIGGDRWRGTPLHLSGERK